MSSRSFALVAAAAFGLGGCVNAVVDDAAFSAAGKSDAQKPEIWSPQDAPSLFSASLTYTLSQLPAQGEAARIPWAGSYWPVYEDGINRKWDGATSEAPSTKYGRAFAVTGVEDAVSRANGVDSQSHRTKCTTATAATACKADLGEQCAIREGKTEGYCIPSWFGICHAWAPAAILMPEPKRPVTRNGVTFKVNDLKALASLVHEGVDTKFVSLRCNRDDRPGVDGNVEFDAHGRPVDRACRDSNAGSFHVLVTNYLGVQRASFVFDRTYDDEVWNQPLRGYKVVETREVDVKTALGLVGAAATGGASQTLTANVTKATWKHFDPIAVTAGAPFKVVMSGTGDGDLFVNFGARPTESTYACRPYADGSDETCDVVVPAGATQAFVSVNGYTDANVSLVVSNGGTAPTTWTFNPAAAKLQYVKLDVSYIGESASETDGNLGSTIDRYTATDRYEYVLELDAAGKIVGGEWVGQSKRFHPDFAWLPIAARNASVAGGKIRYADVKSLLDESILDPQTPGTGGPAPTPKSETKTGTLLKDQWAQFGPYNTQPGTNLVVTMTGTGDADLYVKAGTAPTSSTYDCRPYKSGSAESCSVLGGGPIFISVNGYATSSNFSLSIQWTEAGNGGVVTPPPPPPNPTAHLNVTGEVALGAYAYYTLNVTAGKPIVIRTTAANDIDVYLQMGSNPTEGNAIAQAYTSSGNETLRFVPSTSGSLTIGVHGYAASAFTLTTADQ